MAIESYGLGQLVNAAVADVITVRLHTGDPGPNGSANLIGLDVLPRVDIPAGAGGWTITAANGHAETKADVDFGNAKKAVNNVGWYSLFKGANFFARRQLAQQKNVVANAPVSIDAGTIDITVSSAD